MGLDDRFTSAYDDSYGRRYSSGAVSNNDASVLAYGNANAGEPLARRQRRAASVGPLTSNTPGTPLWVVAERNEEAGA